MSIIILQKETGHENIFNSDQRKIYPFQSGGLQFESYAKDYQDQIVIGEYTINNRVDYILEQIYKAKPDVLCFSCYIWNMDYVEELITEYHKLCPEVPIWVGGPEVPMRWKLF